MKNDNDSSASQSQADRLDQPSSHTAQPPQAESSSAKPYNDTAGYSVDEAPPGYVAVEAPTDVRQPLLGASGAAGGGGAEAMYIVNEPRQDGDELLIDILLYLVALVIPPASVIVKRGFGCQFWLNVLLTMFGGVPGLLHAWYIVAVTPGTIRNRHRFNRDDVEQQQQEQMPQRGEPARIQI